MTRPQCGDDCACLTQCGDAYANEFDGLLDELRAFVDRRLPKPKPQPTRRDPTDSELVDIFFRSIPPDWLNRSDRTIEACLRMMRAAIAVSRMDARTQAGASESQPQGATE